MPVSVVPNPENATYPWRLMLECRHFLPLIVEPPATIVGPFACAHCTGGCAPRYQPIEGYRLDDWKSLKADKPLGLSRA